MNGTTKTTETEAPRSAREELLQLGFSFFTSEKGLELAALVGRAFAEGSNARVRQGIAYDERVLSELILRDMVSGLDAKTALEEVDVIVQAARAVTRKFILSFAECADCKAERAAQASGPLGMTPITPEKIREGVARRMYAAVNGGGRTWETATSEEREAYLAQATEHDKFYAETLNEIFGAARKAAEPPETDGAPS